MLGIYKEKKRRREKEKLVGELAIYKEKKRIREISRMVKLVIDRIYKDLHVRQTGN